MTAPFCARCGLEAMASSEKGLRVRPRRMRAQAEMRFIASCHRQLLIRTSSRNQKDRVMRRTSKDALVLGRLCEISCALFASRSRCTPTVRPDCSNIHRGISIARASSFGVNPQRTTCCRWLTRVTWTHTVRPNHGCQRYWTSCDSVLWVFRCWVVQHETTALILGLSTADPSCS
jgi:hypothetical protein